MGVALTYNPSLTGLYVHAGVSDAFYRLVEVEVERISHQNLQYPWYRRGNPGEWGFGGRV
jgi:hypothetical protein